MNLILKHRVHQMETESASAHEIFNPEKFLNNSILQLVKEEENEKEIQQKDLFIELQNRLFIEFLHLLTDSVECQKMSKKKSEHLLEKIKENDDKISEIESALEKTQQSINFSVNDESTPNYAITIQNSSEYNQDSTPTHVAASSSDEKSVCEGGMYSFQQDEESQIKKLIEDLSEDEKSVCEGGMYSFQQDEEESQIKKLIKELSEHQKKQGTEQKVSKENISCTNSTESSISTIFTESTNSTDKFQNNIEQDNLRKRKNYAREKMEETPLFVLDLKKYIKDEFFLNEMYNLTTRFNNAKRSLEDDLESYSTDRTIKKGRITLGDYKKMKEKHLGDYINIC
jgi:hypothetical protein